jgi:3-oxoacyl-[acyl-carrier-protein] synthase-1
MTVSPVLEIRASGAVTAVGLTAAQTCAAVRAGIRRFSPIEAQILEHIEPRVGARVSAAPELRADDASWLLNLAARALQDCEPAGAGPEPEPAPVLLWLIPEAHRGHPLSTGVADNELLVRLEQLSGRRFAPGSRVLHSGAAGCIEALGVARELLVSGAATRCLIGGADSLLRRSDLDRLARENRLLGPTQSQGLVPGEAAAFILVALPEAAPADTPSPSYVGVCGVGLDYERETVLGTTYSVGAAFGSALDTAIADAGIAEADIDFVAGNYNGERYDAWESAHAHARGYRTRRERLPVSWSAGSVGETGVVGGVIALITAAAAIQGEYGAGPIAAVEVRSDGELRGVAILR